MRGRRKGRWGSILSACGGCLALILYYHTAFGAEKKAFSPGNTLPEFKLVAPASADEQLYLGLKARKPFTLSQIPAKLIILEIFGVFCPHCRIQAPILNKIHNFIQRDQDLNNDIKIIGIAAKGNRDQVLTWKMYFRVPFPLFPDTKLHIWRKIGKPDTPCTLLMTPSGKVLSTHLGPTEDVEEFFRRIKEFHKQL
jgi:thiol-disulfide isomerase/thioredoxin